MAFVPCQDNKLKAFVTVVNIWLQTQSESHSLQSYKVLFHCEILQIYLILSN